MHRSFLLPGRSYGHGIGYTIDKIFTVSFRTIAHVFDCEPL